MHEMGIATEISRIVLEEAERGGGGRVKSISLTIGRWSGVEVETLRFAMEVVAEDTSLAGAELKIEVVEPTFKCAECGKEFIAESRLTPCPECESMAGDMVAGDELAIKEIEVED
ncbi:MAG: hydrogenase maturation nickel metallochaperone HypA [Deltaproteobacteria bacterium]|nr:MAG: hydrogenase maturation nickel metallochaperone HypA [Deltaproteobacteria bacterium]